MSVGQRSVEREIKKTFKSKLIRRGAVGTWTILPIPFDAEKVFHRKARVAVRGTLNGFPFRSSIMPAGDGTHFMVVNKESQKGAKVSPGDTATVTMQLDDSSRAVSIPDDLRRSFSKTKRAQRAFANLSYSRKKEFVDWITDAKRPETRSRRVKEALEMLAVGRHPKS